MDVRELSQGERGAFDPLFRALHPRALRLAQARLGATRAADAAQAALERVFARAGEFTPGRPVLPWFYAIVVNEVRAVAREGGEGRSEAERLAGEAWAAPPEDPERLLLEEEAPPCRRARGGVARRRVGRDDRGAARRRCAARDRRARLPQACLPRLRAPAPAPWRFRWWLTKAVPTAPRAARTSWPACGRACSGRSW